MSFVPNRTVRANPVPNAELKIVAHAILSFMMEGPEKCTNVTAVYLKLAKCTMRGQHGTRAAICVCVKLALSHARQCSVHNWRAHILLQIQMDAVECVATVNMKIKSTATGKGSSQTRAMFANVLMDR